MTKRRPSWSDWRLRVAAFACGLLLLNVPGPLRAAEQSVQKSVPAKKAAPAKGKSRDAKKPAVAPLPSEVGAADIIEWESTGLHGSASFYAQSFHGRRTATGETFDLRGFTGASNVFPLGTWVAVRRLDNSRCAIVKINDRMHASHRKRIIDVSRAVAEYLDMIRAGVVLVRVAPIKGEPQGGRACAGSFEAGETPTEPAATTGWRDSVRVPSSVPQLDAMH